MRLTAPPGSATASPGGLHFEPGDLFAERYTIVEEIGAGGQAQVYKARDRALGRTVALKLIPPAVARRSTHLGRFQRELALARQVDHPNVCRLYDIGEVNGIHFISMEFIDGQTLGDWIQAVGSLSPQQTVSVARQICAGLDAIHQKSIVHRDLKPANIMLDRSGRAVVMDFGLAHHPEADALTAPGETLGTLAYLSPEQARAERLDGRSDIYSLGLILFEMLTGRRPPADDNRIPLALRHPEAICPPPSRLAPGVPAELDEVVLRCLRWERERRFPAVRDVEASLGRISGVGPAVSPARPERASLRRPLVLAAAAAILAGIALYLVSRALVPGRPVEIALLPLAYEGSEQRGYLADLVPVALARGLRGSEGLVLAPFESSRTFSPLDDPDLVSRQLGVDYVLRGEVRSEEESFVATLRLHRRGRDGDLWSGTFTGRLAEPLASLQSAAREVAAELGAGPRDVARSGPSPRALELYLEGMKYLEGWDVERNVARAVEAFRRAIEEDEAFAEAHAGLALGLWKHYEQTRQAPLVDEALNEARLAVSLEPLPESYLALGVVQLGTGRSAEAAASFERALDLAPGDDAICRRIGDAYAALQREESAESMYDRAIALRPAYWENYNRKGRFLVQAGRLAAAKQAFQNVIRLRPESDTGYTNLAAVHILAGEPEEAEPLLRAALRIHPSAYVHNNLGIVYYSSGQFESSARHFREAIERGEDHPTPWANLGDAYRQLGRREEAQEAYRRAVALIRRGLEINPADGEARALLSSALAGLDRCDEAEREAAEAAVQAPANGRVHYLAAVALVVCGNPAAAIAHVERAVERGFLIDVKTNPDLRPLLDAPSLQGILDR